MNCSLTAAFKFSTSGCLKCFEHPTAILQWQHKHLHQAKGLCVWKSSQLSGLSPTNDIWRRPCAATEKKMNMFLPDQQNTTTKTSVHSEQILRYRLSFMQHEFYTQLLLFRVIKRTTKNLFWMFSAGRRECHASWSQASLIYILQHLSPTGPCQSPTEPCPSPTELHPSTTKPRLSPNEPCLSPTKSYPSPTEPCQTKPCLSPTELCLNPTELFPSPIKPCPSPTEPYLGLPSWWGLEESTSQLWTLDSVVWAHP